MPPTGRPFAKGGDERRNAGGRPSIPDDVKEALKGLTLPAVQRLALLLESDNEEVAFKAAMAVLDRNLGKAVQGLFVVTTELPPSTETAIPNAAPQEQHVAATVEVLRRVDRLALLGAAGGADGGAHAEVDEVHSAPSAPDAEGLPPSE